MTNKTDNKADVSLDSTLNASDLSMDITKEPSNDSIGSSENSEETGIISNTLVILCFRYICIRICTQAIWLALKLSLTRLTLMGFEKGIKDKAEVTV